ncbi:MAG: hydroxyphenylacetyl-CoA thioesterase PaaI [Neomegalonema sp.]|nr:hydroxyphenylacetyl-CoA thioesterase PaaI [Neomegalonema sp.]
MSAAPTQPQALAEACAAAMWANDQACQKLGVRIDAVAPGKATLSMPLTDAMVNGHAIGHGGYIFALADSAFAYACNSYNQNTVAQHCSITYVAPARLGDRLTATAQEVSRSGRSGIYDVRVTNDAGETIAEFRGHSRTIAGRLVGEASEEG